MPPSRLPLPSGALLLEDTAHLWRLTFWSLASVAAGLLLLTRDRRSGYAAMTAGWGLVNVAILVTILRGGPPPPFEAYRRIVLLNLGLNLVWIGIGAAMLRRHSNVWVRGAGLAMLQQGAALQALDLFLYVRITL